MIHSKSYFWLQPAAPSAIAVLRMSFDKHGVAAHACFSRAIPDIGRAAYGMFLNAAAQETDEVVILRIDQHTCDVHCHGGVGIRAHIDAAMASHAYQEVEAAIDAQWMEFSRIAHPAALPYLHNWEDLQPSLKAYCMRQPVVLLTGPANAGKSTLLNAWCGHQRALVSDRAGTTRDLIAAVTTCHGWNLRVIDSAGLRESADVLEHAGQELVAKARSWADVVVYLEPFNHTESYAQDDDIVVSGKWDQRISDENEESLHWSAEPWNTSISVQQQLQALAEAVLNKLGLPFLS